MNNESNEILRNARADLDAGKIERWQYEAIILSVMRSEVDEHCVIYADGDLYIEPRSVIYIPTFARQA